LKILRIASIFHNYPEEMAEEVITTDLDREKAFKLVDEWNEQLRYRSKWLFVAEPDDYVPKKQCD
jgi:hypothetical protein